MNYLKIAAVALALGGLSGCVGVTGQTAGTDIAASRAYDDGCGWGVQDAEIKMSMAYERHTGEYDAANEGSFRAGYEKCWMENRK